MLVANSACGSYSRCRERLLKISVLFPPHEISGHINDAF